MTSFITKVKDRIFDNPLIFDSIRWVLLGGYGTMRKNVIKAMDYQPGEQVLEIGCGTGIFAKPFKTNFVGVDASELFISHAKKKYPQLEWHVGTSQSINYPENSFDKILLLNFIHFLTDEDAKELLEKCSKMAKKGVYIMEPLAGYGFLSTFLYSQNRGHNIKTLSQIKEHISSKLSISRAEPFYSLFYPLVMVSCTSPDDKPGPTG